MLAATLSTAEILHRFDTERQFLSVPGITVERSGPLLIHHSDTQHCVAWQDAGPHFPTDVVIKRVIEQFKRWGGTLEWKWFAHDPRSGELAEALLQHGFTAGDRETTMTCPVSELPDMAVSGVDCVTTVQQLPDFTAIAAAVFGKNYDFTTGQLSDTIKRSSQDHVAYVAYDNGAAVGVGRIYLNPASSFAYLAGGGVVSAFRRRGHYRKLVLARAQFAREKNVPFLLTDALPTSRPILQKMGFSKLTETCPYTLA